MSRRVLETLTYLARNHKFVAKLLLHFSISPTAVSKSQSLDQSRGKAVMIVEDHETGKQGHQEGLLAITLLLSLLKQPLYLRSIAHLEQVIDPSFKQYSFLFMFARVSLDIFYLLLFYGFSC